MKKIKKKPFSNGDGVRRSIKEVLEQLLTISSVKNAVQSNGVALCSDKLYLSFVDYKGAEVTCITDAYLYIKQTAKMT